MAFHNTTIDQLPAKKVPIKMLRDAFEHCTPYDSPARARFVSIYPYAWNDVGTEEITMEKAASVLCYCLGNTEHLSRFVGYFTGQQVASYEVVFEFLVQAFIKA